MTKVAVIDHGAGNLVSMMRALDAAGGEPHLVKGGGLSGYDRVVLPGVGATGPAMRTLINTGLAGELRGYGGPLLGICVGMQLLFEYSYEDDTECLGLIGGDVSTINATPLPHIGWNDVETASEGIFAGVNASELFYFVHSFAGRPNDASTVIGRSVYGEDNFVSAVSKGDVTGLQFHPERSGNQGLTLLSNFIAGVSDNTGVSSVA